MKISWDWGWGPMPLAGPGYVNARFTAFGKYL